MAGAISGILRICGNLECDQEGYNFESCEKCKSVYYHAKECQEAHWNVHKKACKKLEVKLIQNLGRAVAKEADNLAKLMQQAIFIGKYFIEGQEVPETMFEDFQSQVFMQTERIASLAKKGEKIFKNHSTSPTALAEDAAQEAESESLAINPGTLSIKIDDID